ncbi:MAG: TRAP transporter small permease subunit [Gammaproteobacteria bacterium]|jgi:TRAP-type mannitol/chloroaromatic compound transport system permease small subunit
MAVLEDGVRVADGGVGPVERGAPQAGRVGTHMDRLAGLLDRTVERIGRASAWLTLLLVMLVAGDVMARYFWHAGSVAEQELEWHVLAVIAMLAASYTVQQGEHVRVDIFYHRYSERVKQWMEALIPLLVVLPVALFLAAVSLKFVSMSYLIHETSPDPGGLPARWLLKAFMPLGFGLVALQGLAMALKNFAVLRRRYGVDRGR